VVLYKDWVCLLLKKFDALRPARYRRQGLGRTRFRDLLTYQWSSMCIFCAVRQTKKPFTLLRFEFDVFCFISNVIVLQLIPEMCRYMQILLLLKACNFDLYHSVAAVIILGLGALFLLFVLLFPERGPSHSCETWWEMLSGSFMRVKATPVFHLDLLVWKI